METQQNGNSLILTFGLNEKRKFMETIEANKDAFLIEQVFINNGYCLELRAVRRFL